MIIVKLFGGLGNQMFQYALGRNLSFKNNVELKFDLDFFKNAGGYVERRNGLEYFDIVGVDATPEDLQKFNIGKLKILWQKAIRPYHKRTVIEEPHYHFANDVLRIKDDVFLRGYWQSEKYFKEIEDVIRRDFTLIKPVSEICSSFINKILNSDSVSVHFRRGDYLRHQIISTIGVQSWDYYYRALNIISSKTIKPHLFVFSDDIEWVKTNINTKLDITYVSGPYLKDYEEQYLMSLCKHNVIANSSFSWWAAWLNKNVNKIVIAPKLWFKDLSMDTKDLMPDSWIRI